MSLNVRWPHERFYWAELALQGPAPTIRRMHSNQARAHLGELFAPSLPQDLETMAPAYLSLDNGRVLACAVSRELLDRELPHDAVTLAPQCVPSWVTDSVEPGRLNVLVAENEPKAVSRLRKRRALLIYILAMLVAGLALFGIERRVRAARAEETAALAALNRMVTSPAAKSIAISTSDRFETRVGRELTNLRSTRSHAARNGVTDVVPAVQALLTTWPRRLHTQVTTLTATPSQLTLTALLPSHQGADELARAIDVQGWAGDSQPQINSTAAGVQVQLSLKPIVNDLRATGQTP